MRLRNLAICIGMLTLAAVGPVPVQARGWEPVRGVREDTRLVIRESEIEIQSAPGVIQVSSNRPVQIKIFTILGRLVSSETVPQGTQQFRVPAHGVYIVKVGQLTCKVAV